MEVEGRGGSEVRRRGVKEKEGVEKRYSGEEGRQKEG